MTYFLIAAGGIVFGLVLFLVDRYANSDLSLNGLQDTPRWNWRYWIGYTKRTWEYDSDLSTLQRHWHYWTPAQVARKVLRERYDPDEVQRFSHVFGGRRGGGKKAKI